MITGDIILSFFKYTFLNQFLQRVQRKKLAMNSTALVQSTTSTFLFLYGTSHQLRVNISGYFLFDLLYLLTQREINLSNSIYYYLKTKPEAHTKIQPTVLEKQLHNYKLQFWKKVQKFWFSGIRVILGSYLLYFELKPPNNIRPLLPVLPLYFLGIVWSLYLHKSQ